MPEATRVPCNSEHRAVHTALLPLLGYLVVDLVLWGKLSKHLVFSAREYGRQYVNSVLRILPAGRFRIHPVLSSLLEGGQDL